MKRFGFKDFIVALPWLGWGGLALYLCWCGPWFTPGDVEETNIFWSLVRVWTVLTGLVLGYILFGAKTHLHLEEPDADLRLEHMNSRIITLSLIGGFSIAMPALAFTIIGFVAMVPHFNRGFAGKAELTLPDRQQLQVSPGSRSYIVAVDVSQSNLPANLGRSRIKDVCDAVQVLLAKEEGVRIVRPEDSFRALVFAGGRDDIISQENTYDKDAIRSTFCPTLGERLKNDIHGSMHTNFESFLDYLGGWASGEAGTHQNVTIFLFSDFMHETSLENTEDIKQTVEAFMTNLKALGDRVRVVGFSMRGDGWKRPTNAVDVIPYLESYGMGQESGARVWYEIPMSSFVSAEPKDRRGLFLFSSYREIPHPEALYLRYRLTPSWAALPSSLEVPEDADHKLLYFSIRSSREGAGSDSRVTVRFEDGKGTAPFRLKLGKNGVPPLGIYHRRSNELEVKLDDEVEVSPSSECDLKIAVPSLGIIHSVNLVMFPTLGGLAEPALRLTLKFLSVALALLALRASGIPEVVRRWRARRGTGRGHAA